MANCDLSNRPKALSNHITYFILSLELDGYGVDESVYYCQRCSWFIRLSHSSISTSSANTLDPL
jgi:hypothetical protein